jgi:peroxiredoxin (alkyl hydroperoxide reductase subunit C)
MANDQPELPGIGDPAPRFEVETPRGLFRFPEYSEGCWCIFFAHPANFTSAWRMYSTFLALKERWFAARNTRLVALSNEDIRLNDWSDKVRRYIGIYLKAPVIEDLDFSIADRFGMASGRRKQPGFDRLAFIIDPDGIIRLIMHNPLPSIENAVLELEKELDRLQGNVPVPAETTPAHTLESLDIPEKSDAVEEYKPKPAYFKRNRQNQN